MNKKPIDKVIKEQNKNSKLRNARNRLQAENEFLKTELLNVEFLKKELEIDKQNLQAENENYSKNNQTMTSDILKLYKELEQAKAENEKLNTFAEIKKEEIVKIIARAKAEAYKECVEKVKTEIDQALKSNYKARAEIEKKDIDLYLDNLFWNYCNGKIDCLRGLEDFCDNLLKELVGDK